MLEFMDIHSGVLLIRCSQEQCCHINIAPITCPTTAEHAEHLHHAQHHEQQHHGEGTSVGVTEGVGKPTVVTWVDDNHSRLVEVVEVFTGAVRVVFRFSITL